MSSKINKCKAIEEETKNAQGIWDPKLPSQVNERVILEKQREFWDLLENNLKKEKLKETDTPFK